MKIYYTSFLLLIAFSINAAPGDTTSLRVHDNVSMVWYENYDQVATFPSNEISWGRILMHYTMGCPSTGCSDWDYTTKIEILVPTGFMDSTIASIDVISEDPYEADTTWNVFVVKRPVELARVITPYGGYMRLGTNGYNNNWTHTHTFDVTDYAPLLKDELTVRAFYGGWSSGFSVTLDFDFIEGTPPREVKEIRNLWRTGGNGWSYSNSQHFESTHAVPMQVQFPVEMAGAKLRFVPSGHGFDNNINCAEFCQRHYYIKLNGNQIGSNNMWDNKCGLNPIFPQGGTWLYDRANWCPGLRVHPFDHELTSLINAGSTHELDLDIEPIVWSGTQAPNYILETQLFIYGPHNHAHDAAIEEIIAPSIKSDYRRYNPICNHARILIKNYGSEVLTSATIRYSVNGNYLNEFLWQGNLAFDESEEIQLPLTQTWQWTLEEGENLFSVYIENPNGQSDENPINDAMTSTFVATPELPANIEVHLRTNNKPLETSWRLFNAFGDLLDQSINSMNAQTLYRDTLNLLPGCYLLRVTDTGKNGLSFWANNDGAGYLRLRNLDNGQMFYQFRADFGTEIDLYFTVGYTLNTGNTIHNIQRGVAIFPNPTNGKFDLEFLHFMNENVVINISNIYGQTVHHESVLLKDNTQEIRPFELQGLTAGTYFVTILSRTGKIVKKLVLNP